MSTVCQKSERTSSDSSGMARYNPHSKKATEAKSIRSRSACQKALTKKQTD